LTVNRNRTRLDCLSNVRLEMARLYRKAKQGKIETSEASRLVYILKEFRCCLEAELLQRLEEHMNVAATEAVERAIVRRQPEPEPRLLQ
jgi:hypothetical protein